MQTGRFFERESAEILSGCFDGCSLPTFVHFVAMDCKDDLGGNTLIPNYLCNGLRVIATRCKTSKNRLKIRRPLRSWGFDPPSRHQQNKMLKTNWPPGIGEAKIVWWLYWWLLILVVICANNNQGKASAVEARRVRWQCPQHWRRDSEESGRSGGVFPYSGMPSQPRRSQTA